MAADPRDFKVELSSTGTAPAAGGGNAAKRPYLSVVFRCCGVYQRIYRSNDGATYSGRCPKCARPVQFKVGPGGTDERFFVVE